MRYLTILTIIGILLLISSVSAVEVFESQGSGVTGKGVDGVRVPLGIPVQFKYLYTWIALGFLGLIATSASQRNSEFWAILLPIFASMFIYFDWLTLNTPDAQAKELGLVIMCGVLAMGIYFKGKQQEKFGIAGPGSTFLNLVFWMVVIQASIGFINAAGLFSADANSAVTPSAYQNADLIETVPQYLETGGLFQSVMSTAVLLPTMAISSLVMVGKILYGIVYFRSLVISIAPFLNGIPVVELFLNAMSVAIDFMIGIAIWVWVFKPPGGESPV